MYLRCSLRWPRKTSSTWPTSALPLRVSVILQTGEPYIVGTKLAVTATHPYYGLLQANSRNDDIPSVGRQIVQCLYEIVWRAF